MDKSFHQGNRQKFYDSLENGTIALFFSGHAFRKTADEFFPFYANRNFVYLTGIEKENFVLMAEKQNDQVHELLFILPPDAHAERWTGSRMRLTKYWSALVSPRPATSTLSRHIFICSCARTILIRLRWICIVVRKRMKIPNPSSGRIASARISLPLILSIVVCS